MTDVYTNLDLWYRQPAHQWVEALPIGNGRLGAMVFGGVEHERIALNEDTLWSGGPREWDNPNAQVVLPEVRRLLAEGNYTEAERLCKQMQGSYTESYQPLGDLLIDFVNTGEATNYRRELDLQTAISTTSFQRNSVVFSREAFVSAPDQVLVVRLSASEPEQISFSARLVSEHPHAVVVHDHNFVLEGACPQHVSPNYYQVEQPVVYGEGDSAGIAFVARLAIVAENGSLDASNTGLRIENADSVTLLLAAETSIAGFDHAPKRQLGEGVFGQLQAACQHSYAKLRARHIDDHAALFARVSLDVGTTNSAYPATKLRQRITAARAGRRTITPTSGGKAGRLAILAMARRYGRTGRWAVPGYANIYGSIMPLVATKHFYANKPTRLCAAQPNSASIG